MSAPVVDTLRHVRQRPGRNPHRPGRITPDNVLDADPRRRTLCGAEPTSDDLAHRDARTRAGREWITCPACADLIDR